MFAAVVNTGRYLVLVRDSTLREFSDSFYVESNGIGLNFRS